MSAGESLQLAAHSRLSGPSSAGADGFLDALENWWRSLRLPAGRGVPAFDLAPGNGPVALPFTGGWFVYLGYELAAEIEPRLCLPPSTDSVMALAIRTPAAWIRDHASGRAWLVAEPGSEMLLDTFERNVGQLADGALDAQGIEHGGRGAGHGERGAEQGERGAGQGERGAEQGGRGAQGAGRGAARDGPRGAPRFDIHEEAPAQFLAAVARSLAYTAAGDVYQVNLSRQWRVTCQDPLDPVSIYQRLRSTNPSPFAALLRWRGFSVMSSSPERLLSIRDGSVATRPIAGTRPRGNTAERDAALIESLLNSDKERAEHVMLIDLERSDLGRVCVGGTVRVDEYMGIETYAHVHHIVSNVTGRLREDVSPIDVIRALFPGGTVTGCPKIRCMEIIAQLEGTGRGAYTGSIGYLNRDGSCDFNILIRTLTADGDALALRAGAGIVADSNPLQELAETRAKAAGMLQALETLP